MEFLSTLNQLDITLFSHDFDGKILEINDTSIGKYISEKGLHYFLAKSQNEYFTIINNQEEFDCSLKTNLGFVKVKGYKVENTIVGRIEKPSLEEQKGLILRESTDEAIMLHEKGVFLDGNEASFSITGYTREEIQGTNIIEGNPLKLSNEVIAKFIHNISNNLEAEFSNIRIYPKDSDESKYVNFKVKNIQLEDDKVVRLLIAKDVTQNYHITQELQRSKQHFEAIAECSSDVFITYTRDKMEYVSPSILFLTSYTPEEFKTHPLSYYLHENDCENLIFSLNEAEKNPNTTIPIANARIFKKGVLDEEKRWKTIELLITYLEGVGDEEGYFIINLRDITSRIHHENSKKRLEEELNQAKKMQTIGTLAGGIAHDFKNILMPIIGYADIIMEELDEHSTHIKNDLRQIIMAGERANDLVNQILTFSHKTEIEKKVISFDELLNNTITLLRASIPSSIEFFVNNEFPRANIEANNTQIQQVIMNICTNASHAMKEKGKITLHVRNISLNGTLKQRFGSLETGHYITLSIEDIGSGIKDEDIERIFDPFFTTKELGKGTGLGLSVAQGIINNHGGIINVTSKVGNGTVFDIFLPVIVDENYFNLKRRQKNLIQRIHQQGQGKILFIDDEEMTRNLVSRVLERAGYFVKTSKDGREGILELRSNNDYDLIITDQSMPKMTGLDIARQAKRIIEDINVILISGSAELLEKDTKSFGVDEFVMKPIIPNDLLNLVQKYIGRKI